MRAKKYTVLDIRDDGDGWKRVTVMASKGVEDFITLEDDFYAVGKTYKRTYMGGGFTVTNEVKS